MGDGMLHYQGHLCVPNEGELRQQILVEDYNSKFPFIRVPLRCTMIYEKSFGGMTEERHHKLYGSVS